MASLLMTDEEVDHQHCLVCYSTLEYAGILPCNHNDVCATCHLRLRHLHSDTKCIMCKTPHEKIVVDKDHTTRIFSEYPIWGDELGSEFVFRKDVGMFFPVDYYEREILPLFGFSCTEPNCDYDGTTPDANMYEEADANNEHRNSKSKKKPSPLRALQDHLRNKHRLTLCQLCVDFRRDFVSVLPRFSPTQLKKHQSKGDGAESGFKGHPVCEFCRPKRFYDLTQLYTHLQKDHYKCDVCDKQGLPNQYFKNYSSLARHFERQHFLCPDPQCLAARFVVFENEIDFRAHERTVHGRTSGGSTKIQLEFRVRRPGQEEMAQQDVPSEEDFQYGLDGQAFVPEPLPRERQPDEQSSHPLHLARTAELRAHAAQIRQEREMETAPDAFPSLSEEAQNGGGGGLRVGWTGEGGTTVVQRVAGNAAMRNTEENFPSLPNAGNKKKAANLKSGRVSGSRSFAAMRSAAMSTASAPGGGSASWGTAAASAASAPTTSSTTPFVVPSSSSAIPTRNREADLTPDNFPSLGGSSSARYPAAGRVASKAQAAPKLSSAADFPPPPTASAKPSVRQKIVGEQKVKAPNQAALDNVLHFPPPTASAGSAEQSKATVEQMKATLGSSKYKQLKSLTKEFASDSLAPEAYVDHAASLFASGYADRDFWTFLPSLLASCPNESSARQASRYMEQLRQSQFMESKPAASVRSTGSGWSAPPTVAAAPASSNFPSSTPAVSSGGWASVSAANRSRPVGVATPAASYRPAMAGSAGSKTKSAWGGSTSGASAVTRAKAPPGSVAVAAAQEGPQTGTATKFMAKQNKQQSRQDQQQQQQSTTTTSKKKSKKKQNAELRALAFGK